eukprot:CAMPEP_0115400812 /NCGR_PEP_ID=MMETSP0271-20121206/15551_1 /TAXON_ID=71861 /ORGANISM="Scrippsiella trochoidea, Strain CCMP3099" /LENGTH=567 /DNA_ID=CAMNT_0002824679 /DNA_START=171 /DNA_END=1874 /DNA_ORIENTATION=-
MLQSAKGMMPATATVASGESMHGCQGASLALADVGQKVSADLRSTNSNDVTGIDKPSNLACVASGNISCERQGDAELEGCMPTPACASARSTEEAGTTSPGDTSSVKCGSDSSEAGDQLRESVSCDGEIGSLPGSQESTEDKVYRPVTSSAQVASCSTNHRTAVLLNEARRRLSSDQKSVRHAGQCSPVLQAVAGHWHYSIAGEVALCVVEADGRTHYNGVHLGEQYDLFEHVCARGVSGIRRGDGWVVDMEQSKMGLLVWRKDGEEDVAWFRTASLAGVGVASPGAWGGRHRASGSSYAVSVAGEIAKAQRAVEVEGGVNRLQTAKAEVASNVAPPTAEEPVKKTCMHLQSESVSGGRTEADIPPSMVGTELSGCKKSSLDQKAGSSAVLQAVAGRWKVTIEGEVIVCIIRADGCAHYNGVHLGDQYDLFEHGCAGSVPSIRRGDGWVVDMQQSKMGMLVWQREGEADIVWRSGACTCRQHCRLSVSRQRQRRDQSEGGRRLRGGAASGPLLMLSLCAKASGVSWAVHRVLAVCGPPFMSFVVSPWFFFGCVGRITKMCAPLTLGA